MSFAALRSDLLVRKGQAAPSTLPAGPPSPPPLRIVVSSAAFAPPAAEPAEASAPTEPVDDADKVRVEVRLTAHQVRRLTLAAALLDRPRRALIGDAVEALLQALNQGRLKSCRCFREGGGVICDPGGRC